MCSRLFSFNKLYWQLSVSGTVNKNILPHLSVHHNARPAWPTILSWAPAQYRRPGQLIGEAHYSLCGLWRTPFFYIILLENMGNNWSSSTCSLCKCVRFILHIINHDDLTGYEEFIINLTPDYWRWIICPEMHDKSLLLTHMKSIIHQELMRWTPWPELTFVYFFVFKCVNKKRLKEYLRNQLSAEEA